MRILIDECIYKRFRNSLTGEWRIHSCQNSCV
jgi:hypothetical protein